MAEENAFARILSRMSAADAGITEKTASAPSTPEPDASARMLSTVRAVTNSVKTAAAAPTPKASLEKMAAEAQQAEESQLIKQAQHLGAALADGFMERFAQYDAALGEIKVAAVGADPAQLQKVAQAAYAQAVQDMEKNAAAEYEAGYNDQLKEVHKIAADVHYIGQQTASAIIQQARTAQ
jgi:hypothetical protein